MRTHYIPQFVLRRFLGGSPLTELNMMEGTIKRLRVSEAAQLEDFYLEDVERKFYGLIDGRAGAVYNQCGFDDPKRLLSAGKLVLTDRQRDDFARWLAMFLFRTPRAYADNATVTRMFAENPKMNRDLIESGVNGFMRKLQSLTDEASREFIARVGIASLEQYVRRRFKDNMQERLRSEAYVHETFNHQNSDKAADHFSVRMKQFHWCWLVSLDRNFIISDGPLCRYLPNIGRPHVPLDEPGVCAAFPVTKSMTLLLSPNPDLADHVRPCSFQSVSNFNHLQINASMVRLFGSYPTINKMAPNVLKTFSTAIAELNSEQRRQQKRQKRNSLP